MTNIETDVLFMQPPEELERKARLQWVVSPASFNLGDAQNALVRDVLQLPQVITESSRHFKAICDDVSTLGDDDDKVLCANRYLSVPLIFSCAQLDSTESWAGRVIMQDDRLPLNIRDYFRINHEQYYGFLTDPFAARGRMEKRFENLLAKGRSMFANLSSPELLSQAGINVQEMLSSMKLLEMSIDYDPIRIDLSNRSRGTAIPREIRSLIGKLRFGLMARAQDSLATALIMQSQNLFASQAYYLALFQERLEEGLDIKLDRAYDMFTLSQGSINFDRYAELIDTDPVITFMRSLVEKEYKDIKPGHVANIGDMFDYGFDLALGLLEPSIFDALFGIKDVERLVTDGISIPRGNLYKTYQWQILMASKAKKTDEY